MQSTFLGPRDILVNQTKPPQQQKTCVHGAYILIREDQ